jgi:predicted DNA-binding transcriptional regulator AlpA
MPEAAILLTAPEAAKALSISERTLWSVTAPRGPLACVRIGKCIRYDVADLRDYIASSKSELAETAG